jgi:hypothetical protein
MPKKEKEKLREREGRSHYPYILYVQYMAGRSDYNDRKKRDALYYTFSMFEAVR